jgi:hypothetical protein
VTLRSTYEIYEGPEPIPFADQLLFVGPHTRRFDSDDLECVAGNSVPAGHAAAGLEYASFGVKSTSCDYSALGSIELHLTERGGEFSIPDRRRLPAAIRSLHLHTHDKALHFTEDTVSALESLIKTGGTNRIDKIYMASSYWGDEDDEDEDEELEETLDQLDALEELCDDAKSGSIALLSMDEEEQGTREYMRIVCEFTPLDSASGVLTAHKGHRLLHLSRRKYVVWPRKAQASDPVTDHHPELYFHQSLHIHDPISCLGLLVVSL